MRRIVPALAALMLAAPAAPALAGGIAEPAPEAIYVPVDDATWDGWYAGLSIGYGDGEGTGPGQVYDGNRIGAFLGYRYDMGNFVIGGEIDFEHGVMYLNGSTTDGVNEMLRSGFEFGYDAGALLPYATLGAVAMWYENPPPIPAFDDISFGLFYGLGLDYDINGSITVGAELLLHQFDDDAPLPGQSQDVTTFNVNAAFRF